MDIVDQATLSHIRFKKDAFIIGIFQSEKKEITALGDIINAEVGMDYKLFGDWVNDQKWGKQLRIKSYEVAKPKDIDAIYRYVVRICRWVGPKIGKKLINQFGPETLDVLKNDPEAVASSVPGITLERAREIRDEILRNENIEGALLELEQIIGGTGLRASLSTDLIAEWGANAPAKIKENPYRLTDFRQVGFKGADGIAVGRLEFDPASILRQKAAILHIVRETIQNGDTWVLCSSLLEKIKQMIGHDGTPGLKALVDENRIVGRGEHVTLKDIDRDETYIAERVKRLLEDSI